jgi:hypothetical protein
MEQNNLALTFIENEDDIFMPAANSTNKIFNLLDIFN